MKRKKRLILACCQAKLYKNQSCTCGDVLPSVTIGKEVITYDSISAFESSSKNMNDSMNKIREAIVSGIVNGDIPESYFIKKDRWDMLHTAVKKFIQKVFENYDLDKYRIVCVPRGGRKYNYDFDFVLKEGEEIIESRHIELKFNAGDVDDTPQFASPMKPSQYMSQSFEKYHYDKVMPRIVSESSDILTMPNESDFMKEIHNNKPPCMTSFQKLYYEGCKSSSKFTDKAEAIHFYESSLRLSKQGIHDFINETDLDCEKVTEYLLNTQAGKIYMLYRNGRFVKQEVNLDDYKITSVKKNPDKSRYECETATGIKLQVLLRWKNGNGIAFPAFQIKAQR